MIRFFAAILTVLTGSLLIVACNAQSTDQPPSVTAETPAEDAVEQLQYGMRTGAVMETFDAASYTYVQVDTGTEVFWAAGPRCEIKAGQQVTIPAGVPMENFHSDSLDRDFPLIFFVDAIHQAGQPQTPSQLPASHPAIGSDSAKPAVDLSEISVSEGGITIGTLYATKNELAGQEVTIRAKVVKVNFGIMGRNWIHIRDGSGTPAEGTDDLTITTNDSAAVGDTVVVSGVVTLDRDFGAGYRYDVIIEDASVTIE